MTAVDDRRAAYVEKVRKLLAKAEATTVQAEADAFYAKATELITTWRIEDAELAEAGGKDELSKVSMTLGTYTPSVDCSVLAAVLKPLGVRVAFTPYGGSGHPPIAWLYGFESDVAKAQLLWASISVQLAGACRAAEPNGLDRGQLRTWRQSFKLGYGSRVAQRLREATATATTAAAAAPSAPAGTALVLVRRADEVDRFVAQETSRGRRSAVQVNSSARAAGDQAARRADLGQSRVSGGTKGALR